MGKQVDVPNKPFDIKSKKPLFDFTAAGWGKQDYVDSYGMFPVEGCGIHQTPPDYIPTTRYIEGKMSGCVTDPGVWSCPG